MSVASMVLTCVGSDRPGLVGDLTQVVAERDGNILESRMAMLGGEFAIIMRVEAPTSALEPLQHALQQHGEAQDLSIHLRPTADHLPRTPGRAYQVRADTMDHPGIVQQVTRFFARLDCNITALETDVWPAPHTGTPMFTLDLTLTVPAQRSIRELRDEFERFCDEIDLDATLEPART